MSVFSFHSSIIALCQWFLSASLFLLLPSSPSPPLDLKTTTKLAAQNVSNNSTNPFLKF